MAYGDAMSCWSGKETVALMIGRDDLTVSDFCGTFASRLTLLVSRTSPLELATSERLSDVDGIDAVDVGEGDEDGVETDVSCVATLAFVMLEGVV